MAGPPPLILRARGLLYAFLHPCPLLNCASNVKNQRHHAKMPAPPPRHMARKRHHFIKCLFTARIFSFFFKKLADLKLSTFLRSSVFLNLVCDLLLYIQHPFDCSPFLFLNLDSFSFPRSILRTHGIISPIAFMVSFHSLKSFLALNIESPSRRSFACGRMITLNQKAIVTVA